MRRIAQPGKLRTSELGTIASSASFRCNSKDHKSPDNYDLAPQVWRVPYTRCTTRLESFFESRAPSLPFELIRIWLCTLFYCSLFIMFFSFASAETQQEGAVNDEAADIDQTPLPSCQTSEMPKIRIDALSWKDEAAVCSIIETTIGRYPSIALARELSKAIVIMQIRGSNDTAADIAYQIMGVVEARNQMSNPSAIDGTLETITKIYNGTGGRVTPKDLNVALRDSGTMATTLTDDGLISIATIIWEHKKSRGE